MTEKLNKIAQKKLHYETKILDLRAEIEKLNATDESTNKKLYDLLQDIEIQLDNLDCQLGTVFELENCI